MYAKENYIFRINPPKFFNTILVKSDGIQQTNTHILTHVLVRDGFEDLLTVLMHLIMTLLVNRPFPNPEQTQ